MAGNTFESSATGADTIPVVKVDADSPFTAYQGGQGESKPGERVALAAPGDALPQGFGKLVIVSDGQDKAAGDAPPKTGPQVQPPLTWIHFNANVTPADHFRWFASGQVSARRPRPCRRRQQYTARAGSRRRKEPSWSGRSDASRRDKTTGLSPRN